MTTLAQPVSQLLAATTVAKGGVNESEALTVDTTLWCAPQPCVL